MTKPSFAEMISTLQLTYLKAKNNEDDKILNKDFWYIIDHLQNDKLYFWSMAMLKAKNIIEGKNFPKVCGILNDYQQSKSYSPKQKRFLAMILLNNWDKVTCYYPGHVTSEYAY
jgi:hypothetical protein